MILVRDGAMSSVTDNRIRYLILETLYEVAQDEDASPWGFDRSSLERSLNVSEKDMDTNVLYLERKGLVKLTQASNVLWFRAKITSFGVEVFENKKRYEEEFPFVKAQNPKRKVGSRK